MKTFAITIRQTTDAESFVVTMDWQAETPREAIYGVRDWHAETFGGRQDILGWREGSCLASLV